MAQSFGEFAGVPQNNLLTESQTGKPPKPEVLPRPAVETKETVPMWDPEREDIVDIPKNHAEHLKAVGWTFPDGSSPVFGEEEAQLRKSEHGGLARTGLAAHNILNSMMFGLPHLGESYVAGVGHKFLPSLFDSPEELDAREAHRARVAENNPVTNVGSDVIGYFIDPEAAVGKGLEKAAVALTGKTAIGAAAGKAVSHATGKTAADAAANAITDKIVAHNFRNKTIGNIATGLTKAGAATLKTGIEMGERGAISEATQEKTNKWEDEEGKKYDHQIDAERVFMAGFKDFGWGLGTEAAIQGAFGVGRLGRLGLSKVTDKVAEAWPHKMVTNKGAPITQGPDELKSRTIKMVKVGTSRAKSKIKEATGGGFEEGSTHAINKVKTDTLENTKANTSFVNKDETLGETRTRTPDIFAQERKYKEPMPEFADEDAASSVNPLKRETGIVWEHGKTQAEYIAGAKQGLEDLINNGSDDSKEAMKELFAHERMLSNLTEKRKATGFLEPDDVKAFNHAKEAKQFWSDFLDKEHPSDDPHKAGFKDYINEYYNAMNNLHEKITPKQIKKDPRFLTRTIKETTEKGREESSFEHNHKYDYKDGTDQTATRTKTNDIKLDESKTKFKKNLDSKNEERETGGDTHHFKPMETLRYAPSKLREKTPLFVPVVRGGMRTPAMYAAGALGYLSGGAIGATVATGSAFAIDTAIAAALNNRAKVAGVVDKATRATAKAAAGTLRTYMRTKTKAEQPEAPEAHNPVDVSQYPKAAENTLKNADPHIAKENVMNGLGEHVASKQPILTQNLIQRNADAGHMLLQHLPKDMRAPGLKQTKFDPPRSQKVKFLKLYNAVTQPLEVMKNPSPAQMEIISKHVPIHARIFRDAISGMLVSAPDKINERKQQQLSIAMGSNFSPRQSPDYIKRIQATAHIDETPKGPAAGGNPSISGPKSAKVTNDAVNIDATPEQLNQLS